MSVSFSRISVTIENQERTEISTIPFDQLAIAKLLGCDQTAEIIKSALKYLEQGHCVRIGSSEIPHSEGMPAYVTFLLTPLYQGESADLTSPRSIISLHGGHKS